MKPIMALAIGVSVFAMSAPAQAAAQAAAQSAAQEHTFQIAQGDLGSALSTYARQAGMQIIFRPADVTGVRSPGAAGRMTSQEALGRLLQGTGFAAYRDPSGAVAISRVKVTRAVSMAPRPAMLAAQDGPAEIGTTAEAPAAPVSDDIVVTAQRRSERLQDVPISMTTLNTQQLAAIGAQQLTEIDKVTPALTFQKIGGFTQPTIRGVGTSLLTPVGGSNVGLYVDGFYSPNPQVLNVQLLNVSGVQVLKGPQGTLFGRNTTGGAILVTTTDPSDKPALRAQASYASRQQQSYQAYATGGLTDGIAVDLAAGFDKGHGWHRNIVDNRRMGDYENWSVRAGVKIAVTDNLSLLLRYTHIDIDDPRPQMINAYCCNAQGKPFAQASYIPGAVVATGPNDVAVTGTQTFKAFSDAYQLRATLDQDWGTITSYTQYRNEAGRTVNDLGVSTVPIAGFDYTYADKIFTQEILATSKGNGRLQWTVGGFYFRDSGPVNTTASFGGAPFVGLIQTTAVVETLAGYADLTYRLGDRLFLTGGLRVAHDSYSDAKDILGPIFQFVFGPPVVRPFPSISRTKATPRFVARYALASDSSIYASFSQGYKSAIRNLSSVIDTSEVRPEQITAYEVGYKIARPGFAFNAAAYYYDYKDLQVSAFKDALATINNAARARVWGFEADGRIRLARQFELTGGFAYTHAQYRSFPNAPDYVQCLDEAACPGALGSIPSSPVNLSNSPMQFAPRFSGNIGYRFSDDFAGGRLNITSTLSYVSKSYFDAAARYYNEGHEDLAMRVEWVDPTDRFTIALFGKNLTDSRYMTAATTVTYGILSLWNEPRTVGVQVGLRY